MNSLVWHLGFCRMVTVMAQKFFCPYFLLIVLWDRPPSRLYWSVNLVNLISRGFLVCILLTMWIYWEINLMTKFDTIKLFVNKLMRSIKWMSKTMKEHLFVKVAFRKLSNDHNYMVLLIRVHVLARPHFSFSSTWIQFIIHQLKTILNINLLLPKSDP